MSTQVMQVPTHVANPNIDATKKLLEKVPTGLLIGDKFVDGENEKFNVLDPANGELLTQVANAGVKDLNKALELAVVTQEKWSKTAPRVRGEVLRKTLVQYDYRHTTGKLFSCVAKSLKEAREKRNKWLILNYGNEPELI